MEELIKLVTQKTGIPDATAKQAVETVLNFLKERLPDPIAGQLDTVLEGGDIGDLMDNVDDISDLAKGLGGLFGK